MLSPLPLDASPGGTPIQALQATGVAAWIVDQTLWRRMPSGSRNRRRWLPLAGWRWVAHDFNNILGGMATYVDFALDQRRRDFDEAGAEEELCSGGGQGREYHECPSCLSFATADKSADDGTWPT